MSLVDGWIQISKARNHDFECNHQVLTRAQSSIIDQGLTLLVKTHMLTENVMIDHEKLGYPILRQTSIEETQRSMEASGGTPQNEAPSYLSAATCNRIATICRKDEV